MDVNDLEQLTSNVPLFTNLENVERNTITSILVMNVYGRGAEVILTLSKDSGKRFVKMIIIENRPTHQEIADMAGTSRETVSIVLSQLQKKQYISIDRKRMAILDEEKLYY